jgi:diacylglycerol kinase (ATP)
MVRYKLILNPASDKWHTKDRLKSLQQLVEQLAAGGSHELVWATTDRPRHAIDLARDSASEAVDVVVAIGGDGTVHEVVNGLMQIPREQRPRLGIIPVGSGNDFAANVGLPKKSEDAAQRLFGGTTRTVDVGTITDGTGRTEYWDNTVGIGFSGAVNIASRNLTKLRGFLGYLVAVLQTIIYKPQELDAKMAFEGHPNHQQGISMLAICNGPREGGGFPVAPDAVLDDGKITYTIMRNVNRAQMLFFLPVVLTAQHLRFKKFFTPGTTTDFSIKTDKTMAIHTDGEVFGPWEADIRQVDITLIPAALDILI